MIAESPEATSDIARLPVTVASIASASIFDREHASTLRSESAAVQALSGILDDEPGSLNRFLNIVLKSCSADTAGISLEQQAAPGKSVLSWHAVAGALAQHAGFSAPRNFSYCGTCLDLAQPLLFMKPQRAFPYLGDMQPAIGELLVIPLVSRRQPRGTLWMAQHDSERRFCADDARTAERLALHLACALELWAHELDHRRALAYRDAQLRDAHHRVKNTLQIAASTLQIDARTTASVSARRALQVGIGRLRVLSKVHELLGQERGNEQIAVHTLLQSVVDAARHSFVEISTRVDLELAAAAVWLPADQAIPLALLANEAVTNACKHAFTGDRSGRICIELSEDSDGVLVLRIADDGIGMATQATNGLGLKLIAGFTEQLRAATSFVEPVGTSGTAVILRMRNAKGES